MTAQPSRNQGMSMEGERDTAIWAVTRFATIAAQERSGETAPIQKQNCLLSLLNAIGNRGSQFF
jgi:hypothetical protein